MEAILAIAIGCLFACGFYLMMRRTLAHLIIGLALMTNATNLLVFVSARLSREGAPLIRPGQEMLEGPTADPLPQALILTAIVIGFGVLGFFIALAYRAYRSLGTDDLHALTTTDRLDDAGYPQVDDEEVAEEVEQVERDEKEIEPAAVGGEARA